MSKNYKHLSSEERDKIAVLHASGIFMSDIAKIISRSKSTVSRELNRNSSKAYNVYLPHKADKRAKERKQEAGKRERLKNQKIRNYVINKLKIGLSPEQIAGRILIDKSNLTISHEAVYQYIYDPKIRKKQDLVSLLARSNKKRQKREHTRKHRKLHIPNRISIDERPSYINKRIQMGHWEADTAISRQSKSALGITVERVSRFVKIAKMKRKSSYELRTALNRRLSRYPQSARKTITYDNGSENVGHEYVNKILGVKSYFCNPYHSWEKGSVENSIGLIRRYLPKKTNFAKVDKKEIKRIENLLNNRPRKCLNYKTPLEVFKSKCCA